MAEDASAQGGRIKTAAMAEGRRKKAGKRSLSNRL